MPVSDSISDRCHFRRDTHSRARCAQEADATVVSSKIVNVVSRCRSEMYCRNVFSDVFNVLFSCFSFEIINSIGSSIVNAIGYPSVNSIMISFVISFSNSIKFRNPPTPNLLITHRVVLSVYIYIYRNIYRYIHLLFMYTLFIHHTTCSSTNRSVKSIEGHRCSTWGQCYLLMRLRLESAPV